MELVITYEIDSSSPSSKATGVANKVVDIRRVQRQAMQPYSLPKGVNKYFARQIGLAPTEDKALIYLQPPGHVYTPNFGYGPITGKVKLHAKSDPFETVDRFPNLPSSRNFFVREITQDGMPYIEKRQFEILDAAYNFTEDSITQRLGLNPEFREAMEAVFGKIGIQTNFIALVRQPIEA